uniref:Ig-like domain-containing protein n=1 Tax=Pundamilia nyererei TaxID=303518 RepID=A0A3B4EUM8_9CICH
MRRGSLKNKIQCCHFSLLSPADAPKPPSVSVRPSGEIKEGTSVTLTCSSDANPAATFVWYKTNGRIPLSKEPQLVFRSIQPSDSGQYYCIAANTVLSHPGHRSQRSLQRKASGLL